MDGTAAAAGATGVVAWAPVLGAVGAAIAGALRAWVPLASTCDEAAVPGARRACVPSAGTWEEESLSDASTAGVPAAFTTCKEDAVSDASTACVPAAWAVGEVVSPLVPAAMTALKAQCEASAFAKALATS